jgi:hypothetical protein
MHRLAREAGVAYKTQLHCIQGRADLSHHRQHPHRRRSRLVALPLVVLCALAYLGSAAHFAFVRHSVCAEHGEAIHLEEVRASASPAEEEESFTDSRLARTSHLALGSHGADVHCAHAFCRREAPPPSAGTVIAASVSTGSVSERFADVVPPEPVERLRLAPKASPPSV